MGKAVIPLTGQFLESALMLPDGMRIKGYNGNMMWDSVDLYVESPDLPDVPEGVMATRLPISYAVNHWKPAMLIVHSDAPTPIYDEVVNDLRTV